MKMIKATPISISLDKETASEIKKKVNKHGLAVSELEILRAVLEKNGIDVFDPGNTISLKEALDDFLTHPDLAQISSEVVLKQFQTIYSTKTAFALPQVSLPSFNLAKSTEYPLHIAARMGDLSAVKKLVESGQKVSQTDLFGSTPLHMAAMYGHKDVVEYLISKGANVNAKTYEYAKNLYYTPLELAVKYAPDTATLSLLLQKGAIVVYWDDPLFMLIDALDVAYEKKDYQKFDLALSKLEVLGQGNKSALWCFLGGEDLPVAVLLQNFATELNDLQFYNRMMDCVNKLYAVDSQEIAHHYVVAKNLLHAFPSENNYKYKIGAYSAVISAEGHFAVFTSALAAKTLQGYCQNISGVWDAQGFKQIKAKYPQTKESLLNDVGYFSEQKQAIFSQVEKTFALGAEAKQNAGQFAFSEALFKAYNEGKTILLPCGWDGHAIDIILNKDLNLFIVANAGDSFPSLPSGINAYNHKFALSANDIYQILNNHQKMEMEFKRFYDLGLYRNEDYSLELPEQAFGNCAWFSQQVSEQALLFLEVSAVVKDHNLAITLSQQWFAQLDEYQKTSILKEYLAAPNLEVAVLGDILLTYHSKLTTPEEKERAKLMLDTLTSSDYKSAFNQYYNQHTYDVSPELKQFIKDNGYKLGHYSFFMQDGNEPLAYHESQSKIPIKFEDVIKVNEKDVLSMLEPTQGLTISPSVEMPSTSLLMVLPAALTTAHEEQPQVII